jgi:hypothetical protein
MHMCSRDLISVECDVVSFGHFAEYFISDKGMRCKYFDEQRKYKVVDFFCYWKYLLSKSQRNAINEQTTKTDCARVYSGQRTKKNFIIQSPTVSRISAKPTTVLPVFHCTNYFHIMVADFCLQIIYFSKRIALLYVLLIIKLVMFCKPINNLVENTAKFN